METALEIYLFLQLKLTFFVADNKCVAVERVMVSQSEEVCQLVELECAYTVLAIKRRSEDAKSFGIVGLFDPTASLASLIRKRKPKGGGGRFLSGAVWHGYGKGSGMSIAGAGLYGKRLLGRNGSGRRQI